MSAFRHIDLRVRDLTTAQEVTRAAGALQLTGPKEMPYGPGYYSIFFADPSGNLLEVYFRPE